MKLWFPAVLLLAVLSAWAQPKPSPSATPTPEAKATSDVYTVGDGVSAPTLLHKVEPEYTEEARLAKYQGTVLLSVVIDPNGTATNIKVVHSPGLGLDEKAIEAVQKWTFRPGFKDDKPVKVGAIVEVDFRLPQEKTSGQGER